MGTATMVPLSEYLHTSYEPDREWVNGVLKERGMPDGYHAYFQGRLVAYFNQLHPEFNLRGLPELRCRISAVNYRVPDVALIPSKARFLPLPDKLPLVCIEVLSPDDERGDLQEKIEDYVRAGIAAIWIVDPRRRTMFIGDAAGMHPVESFRLAGTEVNVTSAELFAELDELEAR